MTLVQSKTLTKTPQLYSVLKKSFVVKPDSCGRSETLRAGSCDDIQKFYSNLQECLTLYRNIILVCHRHINLSRTFPLCTRETCVWSSTTPVPGCP